MPAPLFRPPGGERTPTEEWVEDTVLRPAKVRRPVLPDAYFDRFDTKKYQSKNPVQRHLIRGFVKALHSIFVGAGPSQRVVEIGVGEGFLSGYLSEAFPEKEFTGVDLNPEDVERVRKKFPRIQAHAGSILDLSFLTPPYDVLMCCEVLEHVPQTEQALDSLASLGAKRLILSVPHEPFFMLSNFARGKNITRFGNDPEHINHWSKRGFVRLLESRFDVLEVETPYPWTIALCAPRGR